MTTVCMFSTLYGGLYWLFSGYCTLNRSIYAICMRFHTFVQFFGSLCWKWTAGNLSTTTFYSECDTQIFEFFFFVALCVCHGMARFCVFATGCGASLVVAKHKRCVNENQKKEPTTTESLRVFFSDALAKNAQLGNNHQKQNRLPLKTKTKKIECCIFPLNCITVRFYRH